MYFSVCTAVKCTVMCSVIIDLNRLYNIPFSVNDRNMIILCNFVSSRFVYQIDKIQICSVGAISDILFIFDKFIIYIFCCICNIFRNRSDLLIPAYEYIFSVFIVCFCRSITVIGRNCAVFCTCIGFKYCSVIVLPYDSISVDRFRETAARNSVRIRCTASSFPAGPLPAPHRR